MLLPTLILFFLTLAQAAPSFNFLGIRNLSPADSRRIPSPVQATPVMASSAPECTHGAPASQQGPNATAYPIDGYTKVIPLDNATVSYGVRREWEGSHYVSGPHYLGAGHLTDPYAAFKCQYTCNAEDSCRAYFIQYVSVNTEDEHAECTLYDALLQPEMLVAIANTTIGGGGYDKLCNGTTSELV
ncbi:hypothetical protein B0T14DRAFT_115747 [Immersiella caudata]|uniref:Apple domain-containing protein n=1 Tax=Immersiella caudata TaxID=314043 RepID=A0AA39X4Q4_9PEZI|nr:hypothetical protein B0T14DRAFT_115747 [Immersiella caudata]